MNILFINPSKRGMNTDPYRNWAYFAELAPLPVVITRPGEYVTRRGERVSVERSSEHQDFGCTGHYASGQTDDWHRSGRLFAGCKSDNDIVQSCADAEVSA